jgi:hypothetical protein
MSWRLIFAFLLLAAGASAWGGLQLGDWLIAHGPAQMQMPAPHPELDQTAVLDANGKPYVASAPQVLSDGRQGVPELAPPVDWKIQQTSSLLDSGAPIAMATTTISMDEAIALASQNQLGDGLQGIAQLGALGGSQVVQPIDVTAATPAPSSAQTAAQDNSWQTAFQSELKACESEGFFSRPSCAWAARNKYCGPHNAWGRVADCPAKKSGF